MSRRKNNDDEYADEQPSRWIAGRGYQREGEMQRPNTLQRRIFDRFSDLGLSLSSSLRHMTKGHGQTRAARRQFRLQSVILAGQSPLGRLVLCLVFLQLAWFLIRDLV